MKDTIEYYSLLVTACISIIISLLDLTGLLGGTFLASRTPILTLLVLGIVVGYLSLERRSKLDKIEQLLKESFENLPSLMGGQIKALKNSQDAYRYIAQRITKAKRRVDDLSWGAITTTRRTAEQEHAFQKYLESLVATASRKDIIYREVMTFHKEERVNRAEEMIARNIFGYQLRYYDIPFEGIPPLLQFMVIDSEEVILAFYKSGNLPVIDELYLAITHPEIVRYFQDYYDSIWQGAKVIKEAGKSVHEAVLQQMRQRISAEHGNWGG